MKIVQSTFLILTFSRIRKGECPKTLSNREVCWEPQPHLGWTVMRTTLVGCYLLDIQFCLSLLTVRMPDIMVCIIQLRKMGLRIFERPLKFPPPVNEGGVLQTQVNAGASFSWCSPVDFQLLCVQGKEDWTYVLQGVRPVTGKEAWC